MSADSSVHDPQVRDEVGNARLYAAAAKPVQDSLAIVTLNGANLPEQYQGYIYSKWLKSLRVDNDIFGMIHPEGYWKPYAAFITSLLKRPGTIVRLAVLEPDLDVVLGFSVVRGNILDYVHVLQIRLNTDTGQEVIDYRRKGIASMLIPAEVDTFTHITNSAMRVWKRSKRAKLWKFKPFE